MRGATVCDEPVFEVLAPMRFQTLIFVVFHRRQFVLQFVVVAVVVVDVISIAQEHLSLCFFEKKKKKTVKKKKKKKKKRIGKEIVTQTIY
jgi:hypothetical protein